ncbi:MAG: C-type cytochrome [Nitrospira sp.]|nr:MAG: C-type cytochrome [Nitrospira sp.]
MQRLLSFALATMATAVVAAVPAVAQHMLPSRVPMAHLEEARALKSPLPDSPDVVEKGKALYHGKGTCANCHGAEGAGDGPVAAQLNPSPRNFQHHGFWRHRTEGEIFWVIKNGSPGTSMIGFAGQLTDEEMWAVIQYERTFAEGHGHGEGMGPRGGMGRRGSRESMGGMGHRGMGSGSGSCEGEQCDR